MSSRFAPFLAFLSIGISMVAASDVGFHLRYQAHFDETRVFVAGEFSDWQLLEMSKDAEGVARIVLDLPPGQYAYKFVINGRTWMLDPHANELKVHGGNLNSAFTIPDVPSGDRLKHRSEYYLDGQEYRIAMRFELYQLIEEDRFDVLERVFQAWRRDDPKIVSGIPKLWLLFEGLRYNYRRMPTEAFYAERFDFLERWRAAYPDSSVEPVVRARMLVAYAWFARGTGFSDTVSDDGWKLFYERMQQAREVLQAAPVEAQEDVNWHLYSYLCEVILDGRPEWSDFRDSFAAFDFDPVPLIFRHAMFSLPRWYGGPGEWQSFARSFAEDGRPDLFARIVWSLFDSFGNRMRIFTRQGIEWPELKAGFEELIRRHPRSAINLNTFALFACLADDRETAAALITTIERGQISAAGSWQGQYDAWRSWALENGSRPSVPAAAGFEEP